MSIPIHVDEYSGHAANQRPRRFTVDEQLYEIEAVLDQLSCRTTSVEILELPLAEIAILYGLEIGNGGLDRLRTTADQRSTALRHAQVDNTPRTHNDASDNSKVFYDPITWKLDHCARDHRWIEITRHSSLMLAANL